MKRFITLTLIIMTAAIVTGCGSKKQEPVTTNTGSNSTGADVICQTAINDYLAKADKKGRGDRIVKKGDNIVVDYVGRLSDKEVFDTSVESVAKACGKYMAGRDYTGGLAFGVGAGQMIAGFDRGVEGMKIGQTKTVVIPAAEAYGEWSQDKLLKIEKSKIPNADQYKAGMQVQTDYGQIFKVYEVTANEVVFDGNHELAGKDLTFDITIKEIK